MDERRLSEQPGARSTTVARAFAIGFGTTAIMWVLSYIAMLQPGAFIGEAIFVLTVLVLVAGAAVGAMADDGSKFATRGIRRGIEIGLVSACINLLLVGSLLGGKTGPDMAASSAAWFGGLFGLSVLLGAIGGAIGSKLPRVDASRINWIGMFAAVCTGITFLMIISGGIVTGFEAGLAVPDWPNSYGHNMLLYPMSEMIADLDSGIYYEHAHRLAGMFVGIASITLCIMLWCGDRRPVICWLGTLILLMVIGQGILGGLRVTGGFTLSDNPEILSPSTGLGIVHGVFGQIVLACMVLVAALSSWTWLRGPAPRPMGSAGAGRVLSWVLLVALLLQLIVGAIYRHLASDLEFDTSRTAHILMGHIALAALVALLAIINGIRGMLMEERQPILYRLGLALIVLVSLQLLLGIGATIAVFSHEPGAPVPVSEVAITSAHQANGALLLLAAVLMTAWTYRLTTMPEPVEHSTVAA